MDMYELGRWRMITDFSWKLWRTEIAWDSFLDEGKIKPNVEECGCAEIDWINLTDNRVPRQAFVSTGKKGLFK